MNKYFTFTLLSIFLFLFSLNFFSAVPPQTNFGDLDVNHNSFDSLPENTAHNFSFYVTNSTNLVSDATCNFYLDYQNGTLLFSKQNIPSVLPNEYYVETDSNNFSFLGEHSVGVFCNTSTQTGGLTFTFEVTPSGKSGTNNILLFIIVLILGYGLNLLGFFNRNSTITILGGIILIFVGLYMLQNGIVIYRDNLTLAISYITLFWGAGSSLWAAIEEIQDNM